jgi:hypothetical protein
MKYILSTPFTLSFLKIETERELIEAAQEFALGVVHDVVSNTYYLTADSRATLLQAMNTLDLAGDILTTVLAS